MNDLTRLVFREEIPGNPHDHDLDRMVKVCAERGFSISRDDARRAWIDYSRVVGSRWYRLPPRDISLFTILYSRCNEEEPCT